VLRTLKINCRYRHRGSGSAAMDISGTLNDMKKWSVDFSLSTQTKERKTSIFRSVSFS
jgi:hypothetical protein